MKSVCVFCASSIGARSVYRELAHDLGAGIARRGLTLVYGGGNVGLMGVLADAALAADGTVIGFMPRSLIQREIAHTGLTELQVTGSIHERKAAMAERADGFIALPGGFGTLDEFCEILTWAQLGIHQKPCGLLDIADDGYFAPLLRFFNHAVSEGFIRPAHRELVLQDTDPVHLLDRMASWQPTATVKWSDLPSPSG